MIDCRPLNSLVFVSVAATLVFTGCTDAPIAPENQGDDAGDNATIPREADELPGGTSPAGTDPCEAHEHCRWQARGVNTEAPFSDEDLGDQAIIDDDGTVTLDDSGHPQDVLWIPNTAAATVSLFDANQREEIGRYRSDPSAEAAPSRTALRDDAGVYVANRQAHSVVHLGLAPNCPGAVDGAGPTTSTGPDDVLDWGADDCLLWRTPLEGYGAVNAVAAGDDEGDAILWVGAEDNSLWKLEGDTGRVLFRTESPVSPDGMALGDDGQLWIADMRAAQLGRVDTQRCADHGSCEVEICGAQGQDCVKQRLDAPGRVDGLALGPDGEVWLGGDLTRYDPDAAVGQRWTHLVPDHRLRGLHVDNSGRLWGAAFDEGLYRFDRDDPEFSTRVAETRNGSTVAVDVDGRGYAWAINSEHNSAFVVDPGPGLYDGALVDEVAGLDGPQPYADMAAQTVRYAVNDRGRVNLLFENCDPRRHARTQWQTLRFDADLPDGTEILWRLRAARTAPELADAPWLYAGISPDRPSPIDLRAMLAAENLDEAQHLEIEAQLTPSLVGEDFFVPGLHVVDVISECVEVAL